jgi:hypothetical protein
MPIVRRKKTGGRPVDEVIDAYAIRYNLTKKQRYQLKSFVAQVALCKSEEARRLILGVSK